MSRRSKTSAIVCAIVLPVTIAVALLMGKEWNPTATVAFIFILISELVFFGSFILSEKLAEKTKQPITRSVFGTTLCIYALLVFVTSLYFFLKSPEDGLKYLIIIQVLLAAIEAVILVITYNTSKTVFEKDTETMTQVNSLLDSCNRLKYLAETTEDQEQASIYKKLAEDLYFTNLSEACASDSAIEDLISALEIEAEKKSSDNAEKINELCIKLKSQIARRKTMAGARRGTI